MITTSIWYWRSQAANHSRAASLVITGNGSPRLCSGKIRAGS